MNQQSLQRWLGAIGLTLLGLTACGGDIDLEKPQGPPMTAGSGAIASAGGNLSSAGGAPGAAGEPQPSGGTGSGNASNAAGEGGVEASSPAGAAGQGSAGAPAEGPKQIAWLAFDAQPDAVRGVYLVSASAQCFDRITGELEVAKQPAFSPDGTRVAYAAEKEGVYQIFVRELDGGDAQQITTLSQGATYPTFNPSGTGLAFVTGDPEALRDGLVTDSSAMGDLMEVDLKTRTPRLVAAHRANYPYLAPSFSGADRLLVSDSSAIYALYFSDGVWGAPRLSSPPSVCQEPAPSPDGQWVAYPDTCATTLRLYKHRIGVGSPRSCVASSFDRELGIVAPDWGAFGLIAAELLGPDRGLRLFDENDLSERGAIATPKKARNPSWSPASFERSCRQ